MARPLSEGILEVEPEWAEEESGWRSAEEILTAGRPDLAAKLLEGRNATQTNSQERDLDARTTANTIANETGGGLRGSREGISAELKYSNLRRQFGAGATANKRHPSLLGRRRNTLKRFSFPFLCH